MLQRLAAGARSLSSYRSPAVGSLGISEQLDSPRTNSLIAPKKKSKLSQGLDKPMAENQSTAAQGVLEATGEDICNILNDTLSSSKLFRMFRGCDDASEAIQFEHVIVNTDCSHATAYWTSKVTQRFATLVARTEGERRSAELIHGVHDKICLRLQAKEAVFRTHLIKHMDFRRVPRVFFKHIDSAKSL